VLRIKLLYACTSSISHGSAVPDESHIKIKKEKICACVISDISFFFFFFFTERYIYFSERNRKVFYVLSGAEYGIPDKRK